ncbi:tyrosine-type recombinase/integrase [Bradyrhizobium sp. PMVTL-01]|uniref:tyrosine-type recombinase/integrase n=1 Tax=Bradyrhizobium sp. PMVTL-01 TaxID=3434999 RepID=UPI003F70C477
MPRLRFNDLLLEQLRYDRKQAAPSGDIAHEDELCPGLFLRVRPSGLKSFSVIYKVPGEGGISPSGRLLTGKAHRITLGTWPHIPLREARDKARQALQAASEGRDPRQAQRENNLTTFAWASDRFVEAELKPNIKNWQAVESTLRLHCRPLLGNRPVQSIRRTDIHALLDSMVEEGRHGMAREVRKNLSRFFNWCIDRELVHANPLDGLRRRDLSANYEAGRALTDDEIRQIWRGAGEMGYPFGPIYQLLMLTGQRRGDWAAAQRSELDLGKRLEVPCGRYKSKRDHLVPISDATMAIVDALPERGGYLFTTNGTTPVSGFSKAKTQLDEASGVKAPYRIHDFRVTCETRLASLGFPQEVRDAVLGHMAQGLQRRYNKHQYADEKREALDAYAKHLTAVIAS